VDRSASFGKLDRLGIAVRRFKNPPEGLQAAAEGAIDAFFFDELVLKNLSRNQFPGRIQVLPEIFDHYTVGMAMPPGSTLRESLNRALLKAILSDDWLRLKGRYTGAGGRGGFAPAAG
jgi:ABC-type amino acid transport substrate-binding protein